VVCPRRGRINEKNWVDHNMRGEGMPEVSGDSSRASIIR